jgi:hypothetical protein
MVRDTSKHNPSIALKTDYPVSRPMYNNKQIVPTGIKKWLQNRGLFWSCFCTLLSDEPVSCRIVESLTGPVLAFCYEEPTKCYFFCMYYSPPSPNVQLNQYAVNLTSIFSTGLLHSEYDGLPTLGKKLSRPQSLLFDKLIYS